MIRVSLIAVVTITSTAAAQPLMRAPVVMPMGRPMPRIFSVAGSPFAEGIGDGGLATMAFVDPYDVAPTPDCGYVIADGYSGRVRKVSRDGMIRTVAGNGMAGFAGDGGPAAAAEFHYPRGVAATADGGLLVADEYNRRVRRVSPLGTVTTVAGNGIAGYAGDGGPATAAELALPVSVAALRDGSFLIADSLNGRVRRVAPDGTITTVAGNGGPGFSGDRGPATEAQIGFPVGVSPTPDGGFLIADQYGERVRRVAPDGTISTVAGTGTPGLSGDGGPAAKAQVDYPRGMAALPDGEVLIADQGNERVRRVLPDGTITTLVDTRPFGGPRGLAVTPEGGILIATVSGVQYIDARLPRQSGTRCHRLLVDIARAPRRVRIGTRATIDFRVSMAARVQVMTRSLHRTRQRYMSMGRRVMSRMTMARAGMNRIRFAVPMRRGRYRIQIRVRTADGERAAVMANLRVIGSRTM